MFCSLQAICLGKEECCMKKLAKFLMKPHSVSLSHSLRRLQQLGGAQPPFFLEIHSGMEQTPCRCFVFLEALFPLQAAGSSRPLFLSRKRPKIFHKKAGHFWEFCQKSFWGLQAIWRQGGIYSRSQGNPCNFQKINKEIYHSLHSPAALTKK